MGVNMFMKLLGKLIGKRVVILIDCDGWETIAFERFYIDGTRYAYRFSRPLGRVVLHNDGTVTGYSYVKRWRYA